MTCIPDKHEVEIPVIFVPSEAFTSELTPQLFRSNLPIFKILPLKRVYVTQNSRSIDHKIILTIIYQHPKTKARIQNSLQILFSAASKIFRKTLINLGISLFEVNPIWDSKVFLFVLQIDLIVNSNIRSAILSEVKDIHS